MTRYQTYRWPCLAVLALSFILLAGSMTAQSSDR